MRKHRLQVLIGIFVAGAAATVLVAVLDGDGFDIFFSAAMSMGFVLMFAVTSFRPRDQLMYSEDAWTTWGWPSPRRSGAGWGPKIPDDYDERNS